MKSSSRCNQQLDAVPDGSLESLAIWLRDFLTAIEKRSVKVNCNQADGHVFSKETLLVPLLCARCSTVGTCFLASPGACAAFGSAVKIVSIK